MDAAHREERARRVPPRKGTEPAGPEPERAPEQRADYESQPLTRTEYIAAMVHLYRGELYRATSWRIRLDNTTNWAVLTVAGLLSLAFGSQEPHAHFILLLGLALVSVFWGYESRRYRFADIWTSRVRKIEENFYGPILRRDPSSPEFGWGQLVAQDMFHPAFKITRLEAMRARFLRNYWAIYAILLLAWVIRLAIGTRSVEDVRFRLTLGPFAWWVPLVVLGAWLFLILLLLVVTRKSNAEAEADHWNVTP